MSQAQNPHAENYAEIYDEHDRFLGTVKLRNEEIEHFENTPGFVACLALNDEQIAGLGIYQGDNLWMRRMPDESRNREMAKEALIGILAEAKELGERAKEIIAEHFPEEMATCESYCVFEFGTSRNQYDTTLETVIQCLETTRD